MYSVAMFDLNNFIIKVKAVTIFELGSWNSNEKKS